MFKTSDTQLYSGLLIQTEALSIFSLVSWILYNRPVHVRDVLFIYITNYRPLSPHYISFHLRFFFFAFQIQS